MSHYFHATVQLHNSPADCARELFKPSKDQASLYFPSKKLGSFCFCFLWVTF